MAYYVNLEDVDTRWDWTDRQPDGREVTGTKEEAIERLEWYRDGVAAACDDAIAEIKTHVDGQERDF